MKYYHGLAVIRGEPFHIQHKALVDYMLELCRKVTIIIGSIQEQDTEKNPFSFLKRKKMIKNVYQPTPEWERMRILGLQDINNDREWATYVLDHVKESLPDIHAPEAYFCGTHFDSQWFQDSLKIEIFDRTEQKYPYVSGTMVREMCMYQDIRWKLYVHKCNWDVVGELQEKYKWSRK